MVIPDNELSTVKGSVEDIKASAKEAIDELLKALDKVGAIGQHVETPNCIMAINTLEGAQRDMRLANRILDDTSDKISAHAEAFINH